MSGERNAQSEAVVYLERRFECQSVAKAERAPGDGCKPLPSPFDCALSLSTVDFDYFAMPQILA